MKSHVKKTTLALAAILTGTALASGPATADDCFIGEIRIFAGPFAPVGYVLADGRELPINQNQALFSIVGTLYGGNGTSTFAVPDLRGRVPVGAGAGNGAHVADLGQMTGSQTSQAHQVEVQAGGGLVVSSGEPVSVVQPVTGVNYIVCAQGIYPQRP